MDTRYWREIRPKRKTAGLGKSALTSQGHKKKRRQAPELADRRLKSTLLLNLAYLAAAISANKASVLASAW